MVKPRVYRSGAYYRWYCPNCEHTTAGVRAHIVAVNEAREHAGKCRGKA